MLVKILTKILQRRGYLVFDQAKLNKLLKFRYDLGHLDGWEERGKRGPMRDGFEKIC